MYLEDIYTRSRGNDFNVCRLVLMNPFPRKTMYAGHIYTQMQILILHILSADWRLCTYPHKAMYSGHIHIQMQRYCVWIGAQEHTWQLIQHNMTYSYV